MRNWIVCFSKIHIALHSVTAGKCLLTKIHPEFSY